MITNKNPGTYSEDISNVDYQNVRDEKQCKDIRYLKLSQLKYAHEILKDLDHYSKYTGGGYTYPPVKMINNQWYVSTGFYINFSKKLMGYRGDINPIEDAKKSKLNNKTGREYTTKVVTLEELHRSYILEGEKSDKTTILKDRMNNKVIYSNGKAEVGNKSGTYTPLGGRQLTVCAIIRAMIDGCNYQMINSKHLDIYGNKPDKINFWPSQIVCKCGSVDWKDIPRESQNTTPMDQLEVQLNRNTTPAIIVVDDSEISEEYRIKCLKLALELNDLFQKGNVDRTIKDVCNMILSK